LDDRLARRLRPGARAGEGLDVWPAARRRCLPVGSGGARRGDDLARRGRARDGNAADAVRAGRYSSHAWTTRSTAFGGLPVAPLFAPTLPVPASTNARTVSV